MDAAKALIRGKFIAIPPTSRNKKKLQINNLNLHQKQLEKKNNKKKIKEGNKS